MEEATSPAPRPRGGQKLLVPLDRLLPEKSLHPPNVGRQVDPGQTGRVGSLQRRPGPHPPPGPMGAGPPSCPAGALTSQTCGFVRRYIATLWTEEEKKPIKIPFNLGKTREKWREAKTRTAVESVFTVMLMDGCDLLQQHLHLLTATGGEEGRGEEVRLLGSEDGRFRPEPE